MISGLSVLLKLWGVGHCRHPSFRSLPDILACRFLGVFHPSLLSPNFKYHLTQSEDDFEKRKRRLLRGVVTCPLYPKPLYKPWLLPTASSYDQFPQLVILFPTRVCA